MTQPQTQNRATEFLTPVGRLVGGNLYEARTTDSNGQPLVIKSGQNKGQPRSDYYFALAIAKGPEQSWAQTPWGQVIYQKAVASWPQGQTQRQDFAWKITDGDSAIPNKAGNKPCDNEGWPGHWILHFSSSFAPKIVNGDGSANITEKDAVKTGYFVQVYGSVASNESTQTAGIFLNHMAVSMQGYGPEIITGRRIDTRAVGFGAGVQLPPGASAQPIGGALPAPGAPGAPGVSAMPGMAPPAALPGMAPPAALPGMQPPPTAVMPNPALMAPAMPGAMMPPPAAVAPPPAPLTPDQRMTPKANGVPYAEWIRTGWTEAAMIQQGYMV